MLLQKFRDEFLHQNLDFLWREWTSLGVGGAPEVIGKWVVDPEALLLFTSTMARYDPRLFDEMVGWVLKNERFLNVQRLRSIQKREGLSQRNIVGAIAKKVVSSRAGIKWKGVTKEGASAKSGVENLFYLESGKDLPCIGNQDEEFAEYGLIRNVLKDRGLSRPFPTKDRASLLLQIRAFMGVSSRSEILQYLMIHGQGTIQEIADQTYYSWRSVQDVLYEMGHSGIISFPEAKRGRVYYLNSRVWLEMFLRNADEPVEWICWPALFRAFEVLWLVLNSGDIFQRSQLEQSVVLRSLMDDELMPRFMKSGLGGYVGDLSVYTGGEYVEQWICSVQKIVSKITE